MAAGGQAAYQARKDLRRICVFRETPCERKENCLRKLEDSTNESFRNSRRKAWIPPLREPLRFVGAALGNFLETQALFSSPAVCVREH